MFKFVKIAALSAFVGLGALASVPSTAQAQSGGVYLGFGNQGPSVGFHFDDRGRHDVRDRDRGHRRGGYDDRRPDRGGWRGCSAREAVHKAERMGLRRARIVSENRRVVRVEGRGRGGHPTMIVFANDRGCPIVR